MSETILATTDYSIFKNGVLNRDLNPKSVESIVKSMEKYGWIGSPIVVDQNMEIVDGQHRLEAAKYTGVPVRYMVTEIPATKINEIRIALNTTASTWKPDDYVNFYAKSGNKSYQDFVALKEEFGACNNLVCRALNIETKSPKNGTVKIDKAQLEKARVTLARVKSLSIASGKKGNGTVKRTAWVFIAETYKQDVIDELVRLLTNSPQEVLNTFNTLTLLQSTENLYNSRKPFEKKIYFSEDYKKTNGAKAEKSRREKRNGKYGNEVLF